MFDFVFCMNEASDVRASMNVFMILLNISKPNSVIISNRCLLLCVFTSFNVLRVEIVVEGIFLKD